MFRKFLSIATICAALSPIAAHAYVAATPDAELVSPVEEVTYCTQQIKSVHVINGILRDQVGGVVCSDKHMEGREIASLPRTFGAPAPQSPASVLEVDQSYNSVTGAR